MSLSSCQKCMYGGDMLSVFSDCAQQRGRRKRCSPRGAMPYRAVKRAPCSKTHALRPQTYAVRCLRLQTSVAWLLCVAWGMYACTQIVEIRHSLLARGINHTVCCRPCLKQNQRENQQRQKSFPGVPTSVNSLVHVDHVNRLHCAVALHTTPGQMLEHCGMQGELGVDSV
jgi:hypothetical protein